MFPVNFGRLKGLHKTLSGTARGGALGFYPLLPPLQTYISLATLIVLALVSWFLTNLALFWANPKRPPPFLFWRQTIFLSLKLSHQSGAGFCGCQRTGEPLIRRPRPGPDHFHAVRPTSQGPSSVLGGHVPGNTHHPSRHTIPVDWGLIRELPFCLNPCGGGGQATSQPCCRFWIAPPTNPPFPPHTHNPPPPWVQKFHHKTDPALGFAGMRWVSQQFQRSPAVIYCCIYVVLYIYCIYILFIYILYIYIYCIYIVYIYIYIYCIYIYICCWRASPPPP